MNFSVTPAVRTPDPALFGRGPAGQSRFIPCGSLTELRFSGDRFLKNGRPRVIPDLVAEEPETMHKVQKALNWVRHAGSFLSMLSTRRAKEKSSDRLLNQARVAFSDGQLNTGLLRLQESVDVLPGGENLFQGYENLGRFLSILAKDQKFLATASQDDKMLRHARAVNVLNRPNQDGTQPFRTPHYFRALEKTELDLEALAQKAFLVAAGIFSRTVKPDSGDAQVRLAGLLERAGQTKQSMEAYEKAARLDSSYEPAMRSARERLNYNT